MPTTGSVIYRSAAMVGHVPMTGSGTEYTLSRYSGSFPSYKYKITGAKIAVKLRNAAWETLQFYKGSTKLGSMAVNASGGSRSASISSTKSLYTNSALTVKLYSEGQGTQLEGGSYITITVTWEQTDVPSTLSFDSSTIEAGGTVNATIDAAFTSYAHTITIERGDYATSVDLAAGTTTAAISIPAAWSNALPDSSSGEWTARLQTYEDERLIGETQTSLTVQVPADVLPTIDAVSIAAVDGFNGQIIQGISGITVTTDAAGSYSGTIETISVVCGSQSASGSAATIERISASGALDVVITATDSRGRSVSTTESITVIAYKTPSISSITQERCDADGGSSGEKNHMRWAVTANISPVAGNTTVILVERISGSTATTEYNAAIPDGAQVSNLTYDVAEAYQIRYTISDDISTGAAIVRKLPTDYTYMRWAHARKSYGFGMYPQHDNAMELADGMKFYIGGSSLTDQIAGKADAADLAGKADADHTHAAATDSAAGMMSAADKAKLDGVKSYTFAKTYLSGSVASGSTATALSSSAITIPDGATIALTGWGFLNSYGPYAFATGQPNFTVDGNTATFKISLRTTQSAARTVYVHFEYVIIS